MLDITCVEEQDPALAERVRRRFARDRGALAACGFRDLCTYREVFTTRSFLFFVAILVLMRLKREILRVHGWRSASASFGLMYHAHPPTIALPLGLGVKLYTRFTDGTLLLSCSFDSQVPATGDVVRHTGERSVDVAWRQHADHVRARVRRGHVVDPLLTFERFVEMSLQERRANGEPSAASPVR